MTQIYNRPYIPPLHERPPFFENNRGSCIPQEGQLSDRISTLSTQPHERTSWKGAQSLSPMSDHMNYEYPPRAGDHHQNRQESSRNPPREQLPPLSSLFGGSSSQMPTQSPYSERPPSHLFPSPTESRYPGTPTHMDRGYDPSYFPRPPVSRQNTQAPQPNHQDRQYIPPPPRPSQHGAGVESPRYESASRPSPVEVGRHQGSPSVNGWSPHSQSGSRPEYFSRDTSSSFRHGDQHPNGHRQETEKRPPYRGHPAHQAYVPTPAAPATGEVPVAKDGLGPKIWTGTQFLPRFVRSAEVLGEGLCYFYDDGTHCKTVIDGEVVNAHWGVTKAGKPRKRLAIACITCREKKIKCDPDFPRCVQCEKFGRVCKFKNAPRGGQGSPDTPPGDQEDLAQNEASPSRTEAESYRSGRRDKSQSASPSLVQRTSTPDPHPSKRQRTGYTDFTRLTPVPSDASPRPSLQEAPSPSAPWADPLIPAPIERSVLVEWQTNPYVTQPELVTELVAVFFKYVPETAHCILPEGLFTAWVLSHSQKSVDDLMLIYTVLALATVFSPNPDRKPLGNQFAAISRYACDSRHFTLQLVQSRLLLSLYYFAINNPNDAWDFCGSALRAASGLKLNLEMDKGEDAYLESYPYGLTRIGYAESRRRTFWSAYLIDRFNGFCSGHLCIIHPEDVFLRLPCTSALFESQADIQTPFFDLATPTLSSHTAPTVGPMAYLINVSTIWGHVMANIYRMSQRPTPATNNAEFVAFYEVMTQRLRQWNEALPLNLTFSAANMRAAADAGKIPTYIMMHAVYHTTTIKLNRYILKSTFSAAQLAHHISTAKQFARSLLHVLDTLVATNASTTSDRQTPVKFSSPFVGYSIVAVVDVLSTILPSSSVKEALKSFGGAQTILGELATFWQSGRFQLGLIQQRIQQMRELVAAQDDPSKAGFKFTLGIENADCLFEMKDSIEKTFAREYDCFYR